MNKIIKKIIVSIVAIVTICLIHQIITYMFFEKSKIVKIDKKHIVHENKHLGTVEKEWKGNYLVIKQYSNFGCESDSYVRYNKNRVEVLIIEPFITCWGTSYVDMGYTIYYNNIISSLKAYFSENIFLDEKRCTVGKLNCVVNNEIMENYDQLKNFGFIKIEGGSYNLNNLNYTYLSDEK